MLKVFEKIKGSRTPVNEKSILIGDLYLNKTKIFNKEEVGEVMDFVKEHFPRLLDGKVFFINGFAHVMNDSITNSRRLVFVLTCLTNKKGDPLFKLINEQGQPAIKMVAETPEVGKDKIEPDDDESKDDESKDDEEFTDVAEDVVLSKKYKVAELKVIAGGLDAGSDGGKDLVEKIGKMKEGELIDYILENATPEELEKALKGE